MKKKYIKDMKYRKLENVLYYNIYRYIVFSSIK